MRLSGDGHLVVERDLASHFGPDCVVGVPVELRGRGIAARVAVHPHLLHAPRDAALPLAHSQIDPFLDTSREASLDQHGWTAGSWFAFQAETRTMVPTG